MHQEHQEDYHLHHHPPPPVEATSSMSGVSLGAIHSPFGPLLYPCLTHHQSFDRRFVPARAEEMKKPKKRKIMKTIVFLE